MTWSWGGLKTDRPISVLGLATLFESGLWRQEPLSQKQVLQPLEGGIYKEKCILRGGTSLTINAPHYSGYPYYSVRATGSAQNRQTASQMTHDGRPPRQRPAEGRHHTQLHYYRSEERRVGKEGKARKWKP